MKKHEKEETRVKIEILTFLKRDSVAYAGNWNPLTVREDGIFFQKRQYTSQ